jgi:hypothetical protein
MKPEKLSLAEMALGAFSGLLVLAAFLMGVVGVWHGCQSDAPKAEARGLRAHLIEWWCGEGGGAKDFSCGGER